MLILRLLLQYQLAYLQGQISLYFPHNFYFKAAISNFLPRAVKAVC